MDPYYFRKIDTVLKINENVYYEDYALNTIRLGRVVGYEAGHYIVEILEQDEYVTSWREREDLMSVDEWEEYGREAWSWQLERR